VAGLRTENGEVNPVAGMITDVPSRVVRRFFSNKNGIAAERLTFAEAARWLICLHAWDYAGKKAAIVGGTKDGGGTGWLGKIGVVYAKGNTLFETLLLNLVMVTDDGNSILRFSPPIWEQSARTAAKEERRPSGYAELLTWQSRRVLLFREKDHVTGMLSSYGDIFEKENMFIEQMSGWHPSSEKSAIGKYISNKHSANRSLWRNLNAILPQNTLLEKTQKDNIVPGIINWLAYLRQEKHIDAFHFYIRSVGVEYGAMEGVVNELIYDEISINGALLDALDQVWRARVIQAVNVTDQCVYQIGVLAASLSEAIGNDDDKNNNGVRDSAREQAYFDLDNPFRAWLSKINPAIDDIEQTMVLWQKTLLKILFSTANLLIQDAGAKAITGTYKEISNGKKEKKKVWVNTANAHARFRKEIKKILDMN
jgi:CRISPR system Cascade subunit CasA